MINEDFKLSTLGEDLWFKINVVGFLFYFFFAVVRIAKKKNNRQAIVLSAVRLVHQKQPLIRSIE